MKRLILITLVLSLLAVFFTGCEQLPDGVNDTFNSIKDSVLGIFGKGHEHEFTLVSEKDPTCIRAGVLYYECSCGEAKQEAGGAATGHNYDVDETVEATCHSEGSVKYKCANCGNTYTETSPATGEHVFDESVEASRLVVCVNSPCTAVKDREFENKYKDSIVYKFSDEDLDKFYAIHEEVKAIIDAADAYDPELHTFVEGSELHTQYLAMEAKYEELYDLLEYVVGQYQIAQVEYHMDMKNEEKKSNFDYISEMRVDLVADFYEFSKPIYDSMYRDYYYEGMSEEEIQEFLFDSDAVGNDEYKALSDRNTEIEIAFNDLFDPAKDPLVLELYAEFVSNNKRIAEIMGYDNYLEYAYENVYDRDYSYSDVKTICDYVKEYISPIYIDTYDSWNAITQSGVLTQDDINAYYNQVSDSFFETYQSNKLLNDYIDLLILNADTENQMSFSDEFNKLMSDGNLFRGEYEGAYVTYLYGLNIPIAYFGPGYDTPFTVVHEFGHYMNSMYSDEKYNQSFDLLEMHSQGNEILYLSFLSDKMSRFGYQLCETYNLLVMLDTVVTALAVDTFEQAVYTGYYEGTNADVIMADGLIASDEYDLLFEGIIADFGATGYVSEEYWRYVTVLSPCYYVSYSVSALSVLQLYPMAAEDFDGAKDAYLKLFTYVDNYTDEEDYITVEEVLEYAGLYSYTDEELYKSLYEYISSK